ncbi:MAG: hypothetical protein AAGE52_18415 [Myxococcota bacterium]
MISVVCIEGTKGAGKSTTIARVHKTLQARGWRTKIVAPFALANAHAQTLGYPGAVPMFATPETHRATVEFEAEILHGSVDAFRAELGADERAALIFDRGWITFHAHVHDGACDDCDWREAHWKRALGSAPPTVFIHTRPEVTLRRRAGELDEVSGLQSIERVRADWVKRTAMAAAHPDRIALSIETVEERWVDTVTPIVALLGV